MTNRQIAENNGWIIECESPLELRHVEGSFASGIAAETLLEQMPELYPEEEPEGMKTYYFDFPSGHIGGIGVVVASSRQEAYDLAIERITSEPLSRLESLKGFKKEEVLKLVLPNTAIIISNGDY